MFFVNKMLKGFWFILLVCLYWWIEILLFYGWLIEVVLNEKVKLLYWMIECVEYVFLEVSLFMWNRL